MRLISQLYAYQTPGEEISCHLKPPGDGKNEPILVLIDPNPSNITSFVIFWLLTLTNPSISRPQMPNTAACTAPKPWKSINTITVDPQLLLIRTNSQNDGPRCVRVLLGTTAGIT